MRHIFDWGVERHWGEGERGIRVADVGNEWLFVYVST